MRGSGIQSRRGNPPKEKTHELKAGKTRSSPSNKTRYLTPLPQVLVKPEFPGILVLTHISQMSCLALVCNLRHTLQDKGFDAFHAKGTGEPNG
jgi:hypothetical protein